ncbi:MAG: M20/M25/M40 family metallo-hydrolase, partial [Ferrovibrio sp.]
VDRINKIALDHTPGVSTVGLVKVGPNSRNTIPGSVFFTVDLRHPQDETLLVMQSEFQAALAAVCDPLGLTYDCREIWHSPAAHFDSGCIDAVRAAAQQAGYAHMEIVSGAGHDAGYINRVAPTAMIFVPCADGISHNEIEAATPADLAAGCNVLLRAMLAQAG